MNTPTTHRNGAGEAWEGLARQSAQKPLSPGVDPLNYAKVVDLAIKTGNKTPVATVNKVPEFQSKLTTQPEGEPAPTQDAPEDVKPGIETEVNKNVPERQPEAKAVVPAKDTNGSQLEAQNPAAVAKDQEGCSNKEKWSEGEREWRLWSVAPTDKPTVEAHLSLDFLKDMLLDPEDQAEKVWHREVSRTYYYKEKFWYLNDSGKWYAYPKADLLNILEGTEIFLNRPAGKEAGASWVRLKANTFLRRIQTKNVADLVGELPGYLPGLHTYKNRTYLIINGPELIEPAAAGDYGIILQLLHEVLGEEQTEYLLGWLKTADRHLRAGNRVSGQMLIIGGKKDSGKTFIKEHIIRPILGGRHVDPSDSLKGGKFNLDIFKAESWEIDDGVGTKEKRQILTGAIKKMAATSEHRIEGKYADGIQSPPVFIRIHAYVNTDNESDLFAIPDITESIKDKLIILHASQSKHERQSTILPDANVEGAQEEFVEKVRAALPAFIHYLQTREIPEKYRNARFGVGAYINSELEKVLHKASDEGKLLDLIDKLVFISAEVEGPWEGTASELDLLLSRNARLANQTRDLERVKWKGDAIGTGLGILSQQPDSRVSKRPRQGSQGTRGWVIQPPEGHAECLRERARARAKEKAGVQKEIDRLTELKDLREHLNRQVKGMAG